jgi:NhaP-type Na+/H+ or K+/H+ antiporter
MLELASIIILGITAQWISWKIRVPAILPLIITGLFFGPISTLITEDGSKWIEPIYDPISNSGLFPEDIFHFFVSLSIGLILFEGGLTLKLKELSGVSRTIGRLLTIGPVITLIGGGVFAHYVMELNWQVSFLFGALVVVTGPTVIAPILRNLPLKRNVSTILKWEGILIDPIGALFAVLVFEFIFSGEGGRQFTLHALSSFGQIVLIGVSFGFTAAHFLNVLIKKKLIPHYLLNVFTLALALSVFVFSDLLAGESGLLAVVVMGIVLGNLNIPRIEGILDFKESLSVLLISILFITLSADIEIEQLKLLLDYHVVLLFLLLVLVLRPLVVFLSAGKSTLKSNEKLFISLMGPRGIVAAGIASLFGMRLIGVVEDAEYITPLVFMVVLGTVLLNASTARLSAKGLKVLQKKSGGFLFVGANNAARLIAQYMIKNDIHVVLVDNSKSNVEKALSMGLETYKTDIYSDTFGADFELLDIGYMLALTSNSELNKYAIENYRDEYGENGAYRLLNESELGKEHSLLPEECAFSCSSDFINLAETVRDYPTIHELSLTSSNHFEELMKTLKTKIHSIPLFIKTQDDLHVLTSKQKEMKVNAGDKLVYLGNVLESA